MRLAIIGSRTAQNIDIDAAIADIDQPIEAVISGGAKGADSEAAAWARAHGIELVEHLPKYEEHGRRATMIRNRQIIADCDLVLAFWDGESRGTKAALNYARRRGVPCRIVKI